MPRASHPTNGCKRPMSGIPKQVRNDRKKCHAELVYATRAFALRKLFNAALACLGHQHPTGGCKEALIEKKEYKVKSA